MVGIVLSSVGILTAGLFIYATLRSIRDWSVKEDEFSKALEVRRAEINDKEREVKFQLEMEKLNKREQELDDRLLKLSDGDFSYENIKEPEGIPFTYMVEGSPPLTEYYSNKAEIKRAIKKLGRYHYNRYVYYYPE